MTTQTDLLIPSANPAMLESSESCPPPASASEPLISPPSIDGSASNSLRPLAASSPAVATAASPQRNALKLMDRVRLIEWMQTPENTEYIAKNSDAEAADKACHDLGFPITPANITGIRTTLGIAKFKPEKPAAPEPTASPDVDLIILHRQVQELEARQANTASILHDTKQDLAGTAAQLGQAQLKINSQAIEANSTRELVSLLVAHVLHYESLLMNHLAGLNVTERDLTEFKALKPLAPLPIAPATTSSVPFAPPES